MPLIRKFYPQWLIQVGILLTFALIPVWYRLPQSPIFLMPGVIEILASLNPSPMSRETKN